MKTISKLLVLAMVISLAACEKDNESSDLLGNNPKSDPVFSVKMVDAPANYDAVNVEVIAMKARIDSIWSELPLENPGVVNLLGLTNGNSLVLVGDTSLSPGLMTELRLVLGVNNSVVVDGQTYPMKTPSGQTSGYKIKMDPQSMEEGGIYGLVIDFDVNKSVHMTGNGKYMLKPVVRGYLETAIGGIAGIVAPPAGAYYVEAVNMSDTAGTMIDTITGEFLISTALPGSYDVHFFANTGYSDTTIFDVTVFAGQVTQMDTLFIQ
ncbi:MAG: DUF4382 domain-containing protein [Bacteroidales bacterium]|nr:DUF4382 domain-containing protein [Bacteroidales bacterium]